MHRRTDMIFQVSILVLVEYPSEGKAITFRACTSQAVSILVLVEYPSEGRHFARLERPRRSFNPCSGGISF